MSRPLVGSQVALAGSATIQVHLLVVIEQFSGAVEGTVVNTVYLSDTDLYYDYDGTVRHFQAYLLDPGIYTRSIPHVTYPTDGVSLYRDKHSFTVRNGPYVDEVTGTEYISLLAYLQLEEIEGSRITISELLVDPNNDLKDLSSLTGEEQTCIYRGRVDAPAGVTQNSFVLSCSEIVPEPVNAYLHELTGTTALTTGDGPKGHTDDQHTGLALPWTNSSSDAGMRGMIGLVAPINAVVTDLILSDELTSIKILLNGQEDSQRTFAKSTGAPLWSILVGAEIISFDVATGSGLVLTLSTLTRGRNGTTATIHNIGESCTLLTPSHPDCPYFVWLGSMGATLGMGSTSSTIPSETGPWIQNPRDGLLYWTEGNHSILVDTGDGGGGFAEVRALLPDPFGCVIMTETQLRETLLRTLGVPGYGVPIPVDSASYDFNSFHEVLGVYPGPTAPGEHAPPDNLYAHGEGDWDDVVIDNVDADGNTIEWDALVVSEQLVGGVVAQITTSLPSSGATIKKFRFLADFRIDNSGGGTTPYFFLIFPIGFPFGVGWGLSDGTPLFRISADGVDTGRVSYASIWKTVGGVDKFPDELQGSYSGGNWTGVRLLMYASDNYGTFHTSNYASIYKDGFKIEVEFNDFAEPPASIPDRAGVAYTDAASASGIKMYTAIGGQDYTGLSDYVANYQNKGELPNALRFFLQERCGVAAADIDSTSFNDAWDNEFEGLNTGGTPSGVDMDASYMEHELGESFREYMARFCYETMSQIILQHRQTSDVFFWDVPNDPSTSQIDGLTYEYATPTLTITQWDTASEVYKARDQVFTHWNFFWSLRNKGVLSGYRRDGRKSFAQVSVAAPADDFNPSINDFFMTDTETERNRYGVNLAPDQFFVTRRAKAGATDAVRVRKVARFYVRESLRMPISIVTLVDVPWVESYTLELFDTFFLTLPWWTAQKAMRVIAFSHDFKSQFTTITAVEVEIA